MVGGSADLTDAGGDSANNYFRIASLNQLIGVGGLTLSAWVNPDAQSSSAYNGMFMTRTFNGQTNNSWGLAIENNGNERLDSRVDGPGIDSPNGAIAAGSGWHHVALVWDGAAQTHTQYVDGAQTNTTSVAGDGGLGATIVGPTSGPWYIGYDDCCGDNRDFDGRIDEVAVWGEALGATEVRKVYDAALNNISAAEALAASPAAGGPIQSGLVGSWNMDQATGTGAAADSINANHATLTGMDPENDWVAGQVGRALDFDGGNDQAVVGRISQIADSPEMTISLWVRNDGGNENNEGVFQHKDPTDATFNQSFHGLNTPSGGGNANDIEGRANRVSNQSTGADSLPVGDWTHVVQVFKGNEFNRVYINGQLAADVTPTSPLDIVDNIKSGPNGSWRFGNDACCGNRFFDGAMDDTGLWNRAISEEEIATIYQAGLNSISHTRATERLDGTVQQGLIGHWTFDQARFSPAANDSVADADATLTNMDSGSDWIGGILAGALEFDAGNDQAIISGTAASELNSALNGSDALSMSIWLRSDGGNNNNEGIFLHRSSNLTGFNTPSAVTDGFDFRINSGSVKSLGGELVDGEWTHLAGVWESGSRFELYVNGELINTGVAPGGTLTADSDWRFGNDACCGGGRFFNGALDDAGIWDRALSPVEIGRLYTEGLAGLNLAQATVPEPSTLALAGLGLLGLGLTGRRRRRAA
jgi:hypothetical protein